MDKVFLTGATGFIGGHVLTTLLDSGYAVRALVRQGSSAATLDRRCETVRGDLQHTGALVRQIQGCRFLIHCGALYSFSPRDRAAMWRTNVVGTMGILEAARIAAVERTVITSSSATVGACDPHSPATEQNWEVDWGHRSSYHGSKLAQERCALGAQLAVVRLLPSAPVGPADRRPTPTGKMIVDFMRSRMFATLSGGMNLVAVEDVALAHVRALQMGRTGQRYLVGGANLTLTEIFGTLASICKTRAPTRVLPTWVALGLGAADRALGIGRRERQPSIPMEGVRMATRFMYLDDSKARRELDHRPSDVALALDRAVKWFQQAGYA